MRFTGAIGASLAALAVVPQAVGTAGTGRGLGSVEGALSGTIHALEVLAGIDAKGEPLAMTLVREITEDPLPPDPERDRKLDLLRTQVSLLQQELDVVEERLRARATAPPAAQPLARVSDAPPGAEPRPTTPPGVPVAPQRGITKGLDAAALDALRALGVVRSPRTEPPPELSADPVYSADPLLHAQACYRAGLFARGEALLAADESTAGLYWRARCLEELDRLGEARALYATVVERADSGSLADRARTNLEFVDWKAAFLAKLPREEASAKEGAPR